MIREQELVINHLPMKTWYWLKINDKRTKVSMENVDFPADVFATGGVSASDDSSYDEAFSKMETGMGPAFEEYIDSTPYLPDLYVAEAGERSTLSVRFDYEEDGSERQALNLYDVVAKTGSNLVIYTDYLGQKERTALFQMRIIVEKGAHVTLVQSHRFSEDFHFFSNVGVKVQEDASFDLVSVSFSGKELNLALCTDLAGDHSRARYDLGYVSGSASEIDQNYLIRYRGRETEGEIFSNGVLKGTTVKKFRGTIDFIVGAVGAKGAEKEDILLLDDRAVNLTAPLILCGEEDVEGEHGATIGKLPEDTLFYLRARGVSEEDAYRMVANGRMMSVINRIPQTDVNSLKEELTLMVIGEEKEDE